MERERKNDSEWACGWGDPFTDTPSSPLLFMFQSGGETLLRSQSYNHNNSIFQPHLHTQTDRQTQSGPNMLSPPQSRLKCFLPLPTLSSHVLSLVFFSPSSSSIIVFSPPLHHLSLSPLSAVLHLSPLLPSPWHA